MAISNFVPVRRYGAMSAVGLALAAFTTPAMAEISDIEAATITVQDPSPPRDILEAEDAPIAPAQPADDVLEPAPAAPVAPKFRPITGALTQFLSSAVSGSPDNGIKYGGRADVYITIPDGIIGGDNKWILKAHPEFRYGSTTNGLIGVIPEQARLFFPTPDGESFDLAVNLTRRFDSGATLTVGKISIVDVSSTLPVVGGGGIEGFANLAIAQPPSGIVPSSITGAILNMPFGENIVRLWVFDPDTQIQRSGLDDLFGSGVSALAAVSFKTDFLNKPGFITVKAAASTRTGIDLDAIPASLRRPASVVLGREKGQLAVALSFVQLLTADPVLGQNALGIFGQISKANADNSIVDWGGFIGLQGAPSRARPLDKLGVVFFQNSLSDPLVDFLRPIIPFEDERGIEAFYTAQIGKPFRLTANVQVIDSAVEARGTGVLLGLRLRTGF